MDMKFISVYNRIEKVLIFTKKNTKYENIKTK